MKRKIEKTNNHSCVLEETFNLVTSKVLPLTQTYKILKSLDKESGVFAHLLKAYIYLKNANRAKAERIIEEVLSKNYDIYVLQAKHHSMSFEKQLVLLKSLLRYLNEDLGNPKLTKTLLFYLNFYSEGLLVDEMEESFDFPESISSMREFFRSNTFGTPFPFVWGSAILSESSQKEYISYLSQLDMVSLLNKSPHNLYLLKDLTNIPYPKKTVISQFEQLVKSEKIEDMYFFISLAESESFYKFIMANSNIKIGVITNVKRRFFQELTRQKPVSSFAILKLLEIGDDDPEYFYRFLSQQ